MLETDRRVVGLLEELVAWQRFANRSGLLAVLREMNERHLAIFEFLDGSKTQQQLADLFGIKQQSISALIAKWRRMGLVLETEKGYRHIARPSDLGLEVAKPNSSDEKGSRSE